MVHVIEVLLVSRPSGLDAPIAPGGDSTDHRPGHSATDAPRSAERALSHRVPRQEEGEEEAALELPETIAVRRRITAVRRETAAAIAPIQAGSHSPVLRTGHG